MVEEKREDLWDTLPHDLDEVVRALLDPGEEIELAVRGDLAAHGHFGESWLVVTRARLLVLASEAGEETKSVVAAAARRRWWRPAKPAPLPPDAGPRAPGETQPPPAPYSLAHVGVANVLEAKAFETVGCGVLQIAMPGEKEGDPPIWADVLRFSHAQLLRFGDAARAIEALLPRRSEGAEERAGWAKGRRRNRTRCEECGRVLPPGTDICPACLDRGKVLWRLAGYLRPHWKLTLLSLVTSVFLTALALTPPYLMQILIDDVLMKHQHVHLLVLITGALAAVHVVRLVVGAGRDWLNAWLGQQIYFDLRTHLFRHLQKLSMGFYDRKQVGGVLSRVSTDTGTLHYFLVGHAQNLLINSLTVAGIAVVLFMMNWRLAVIVLLPTPLLIVGTFWFSRRIRVVWRRHWRTLSSINSLLVSTISGARVVKSFGQEPREVGRFEERSETFRQIAMRGAALNRIYYPSMALVTVISSVLIWLIGGRQVLAGTLSLGMLTAFTSYMWQFYAPISTLCEINNIVQQAATAAERVFEVLDTEPEVHNSAGAVRIDRIHGEVEFRDVCFSYGEGDSLEPLLKNLNLKVAPGELIGLVGPSGSGKTTLINILLRFYDVSSGQITIDGVDLRDIDLRCLREQMSVVLQEPFLFRGTIAENIAYGRPQASREEIIEAARAANAHKFITKFPDGYDTEVGERGGRLSGGERQHISIARALLNDPRVLVLDEATAAVDTETEKQIQEALDHLMQGRTCFAIAHRLSTLRNATRLVVLDGGRIVEVGTHEELLAKDDGIYARLVRIQTEMAHSIAA